MVNSAGATWQARFCGTRCPVAGSPIEDILQKKMRAFAAPAAIAIARYRFAGRDTLSALFMSLLMIPPVVLGVAFLRFFSLTGLFGTMTGLLIAHVVVVFPFALCMVLASATGMDKRIDDAAVSVGASRPIVYRRIILPLMVPGLAS